MHFIKKIVFIIVLCSTSFYCFSENNKRIRDSLYTIIKNGAHDSLKLNAHISLVKHLLKDDTLAAKAELKKLEYKLLNYRDPLFVLTAHEKLGRIFYNEGLTASSHQLFLKGLAIAKQNKLNYWVTKFYYRIADYLLRIDEVKKSLIYYDSAVHVPNVKDEVFMAKIFSLKGRAHYELGDYKNAMNDYMTSKKLYDKNKVETEEYGHLLHFIGSVFKRQDLNEKALEYYNLELELARKIKNEQLEAEALYLLAGIYGSTGDLEKELDFELKALELFKKAENKRMEALMLGNISVNFADRKNYNKAIYYCEQSLKLYQELGELDQAAWIYSTLGGYYTKLGKHQKALEYLNMGLNAVKNIETKQLLYQSDIMQNIAFAYAGLGNYKAAFENYLEHRSLEDSLHNLENKNYLNDLEKKYDTEKKEQEIALLNKDKLMNQAVIEKQATQKNALTVGGLLVLIIAVISVFAFISNKKKSNLLSKQVHEINYQNAIIKEKNKDITDSIVYAKRLQEAVFPLTNELNNYFCESFVLFRPKDIVSGDFYWFEETNNLTYLIVGDSTGHGVPGAFMSILGHNLLNQIILEEKISSPAEILSTLDNRVTKSLNKKGSKEEYNDGMDIGVCVIDKKSKKLYYSGANRPLIIKRGNEIFELKQNKFAIGGINTKDTKIFTQHEMDYFENDIFYLFSDGYYDQFGGPKGKKFKFKQLQEVLLTNANKSMEDQQKILNEIFDAWKGNLEQVDDVCIIGIRL